MGARHVIESVPYGDTHVRMPTGYSDEDWDMATENAKFDFKRAVEEIININ